MNKWTNIQKIFDNLFKVQLLLNITGCFCNIANGYFAGNFLDNFAISCNSLIIPFNMIVTSIAYIFSSSCEIMCGKYLGAGDRKSLNKTFTIAIRLAVIASIIFTVIPFLFPTYVIKFLGGNSEIMDAAIPYLYAYSIGIFAYLLTPILITFLNIENEGTHATKSVVLLAVLYIVFGYTFTKVLKLSYFGLGLTNSLSQILTMFFLFARLVKNKQQIFFTRTNIDLTYAKRMVLLGIPSGYAGILLSNRNIIFNNIVIKAGGVIAMSAYSVMLSGITIQDSIITSALNTCMIVVSICIGEKNKEELRQLVKHIFTTIVPLNTAFVVLQMILSKQVAGLYASDPNVLYIARNAIVLYLAATIFEMLNDCLIAIYTVFEKYKFVNFFNVMHSFVLHVCFALLMDKYIGYYAVFVSYLFTELASLLIYVIYSTYYNKHLPKSYYDLVVVGHDFDNAKKLYITINSFEKIVNVSEKISKFCLDNNIDKKRSNLAGLCIEEMVTNIFDHGFTKTKIDNKKVDIFVIIDDENLSIRIRDNSIAFNPETRSIIFNPEEPTKNIGLRIVRNMSKEMTYQNLFGLNNTIIKI